MEKCAKFYFKSVYNIDILMFESNRFLQSYLPQYIKQVVSGIKLKGSELDTSLQTLKIMIQAVKMANQIFDAVSTPSSFQAFLSRQFPFVDDKISSMGVCGSSLTTSLIQQENISQFLKCKIGQLSLNCLCLFAKLINFNSQVKRNNIQNNKKINVSKDLTQICFQLKWKFNLMNIQQGLEAQFDEYLECVIMEFINLGVSEGMIKILKGFAENQDSNISSKLRNQILKLGNRELFDPENTLTSSKMTVCKNKDKQQLDFSSLLRKTKTKKQRYVNKVNVTPMKKFGRTDKKRSQICSISPGKQEENLKKQLPSPAKRIQEVIRNNKEKPIQKKRTIFFERKNVYFRKNKDWPEKPQGFFSETSLGSSERAVDLKNSRIDATMDESEDESILVRSTPKVSRKIQMRTICHRLEF